MENEELKNFKTQAVRTTAERLLTSSNTTTTLDVKKRLMMDHPGYFWTQKEVSSMMNDLHNSHLLEYLDNGIYRIYYSELSKKELKKLKKGIKKEQIGRILQNMTKNTENSGIIVSNLITLGELY